ncbi:codeine O-demethylase-like [Chenopodium quinoa]|uniref:Fe2OG dioxygenase domain-containing protein n=1 Tax=Chenopodium quinoa TaxID=63459 RepID=A0A803LH24_CHEQI|nr:codeine O-demethylase-like [Chenopodium quinoa]
MAKEEFLKDDEQKSEEMMGEKYIICKDSYYQPVDKCVTYMEPTLIDYSILTSSQEANDELHKFKSALSSWGCFQLINHGIPTKLLDETKKVSRQFFGLPMEEKQKYAMLPNDTSGHGYQVGNVSHVTSPSSATNKVLDWNEGFSLALFPEHRRKPEFWPDFPPNFKDVFREYAARLETIFDALFKLVVQSLNVDEERFAKQYDKNRETNLRLNFYPKCEGLKQVLGLKPHADFSTMTLLLQDEEGLQVLKDEQWFMVPVIPNALFLNLGDPLEIMSNGIFKSAVHRVVTNTEKERLSVVAFWDSDRNKEIGPLDELITEDRPQIYQRVSLKEYIYTFLNYYQSGKRPINDFKV